MGSPRVRQDLVAEQQQPLLTLTTISVRQGCCCQFTDEATEAQELLSVKAELKTSVFGFHVLSSSPIAHVPTI